jgi:hypothetical protein
MIKCPHCGSSAQPKRVTGPLISDNEIYFYEVYECGCGCRFEVLYEREPCRYFIHHVLKKD